MDALDGFMFKSWSEEFQHIDFSHSFLSFGNHMLMAHAHDIVLTRLTIIITALTHLNSPLAVNWHAHSPPERLTSTLTLQDIIFQCRMAYCAENLHFRAVCDCYSTAFFSS